jgi:NAD(P)-dependent dehydrogenase (short-subunit alcohol dehydrogenase family)
VSERQRPTERRLAVVSGAGRGIGAATARALAVDGWDVVVGFHTDGEAAAAVLAECSRLGARASAIQADLSQPAEIARFWQVVDEHGGAVAGLVNNAGIVTPASDVADMSADRLRRLFDVNVVGAFLMAGAAVRRMARSRGGVGGVIVNVSSRAAIRGGSGEYVDYAASKAAVDVLTAGLALEVADDGVRVVGIRPGLIDTDIHAPGRLDRLVPAVPMGRAGRPEEVAEAIRWLMSDAASYVTGSTLDVGGGR